MLVCVVIVRRWVGFRVVVSMIPDEQERGLERGQEAFGAILPGVDLSFFAPMWRTMVAAQLVTSNLETIARKFELGIGDICVLTAIRSEGERPVRAADLARKLFVTSSGMTTRIDALVRHGLVERRRMDSDRRASIIAITEAGVRVAQDVVDEIAKQSSFVRALRRLSQSEREVFDDLLHQLLIELERHHAFA